MHLDTLLDGQATAIGQGLRRIVSHVDTAWALAGSVAMVAQLEAAGFVSHGRRFGDIDLVVDDLANLPPSLAEGFLCMHLHPNAGSGQILAQFVHPANAVRIDAFRVAGEALSRAALFKFDGFDVRVLSLEDQVAKAAALCMKLARGGAIAAKHAKDFELLLNAVPLPKVEEAWKDYRAASDPAMFETVAPLVRSLISDRSDLLITPKFSQDIASVCSRCESKPPYRIASSDQVFAILGYV